MRDYYLYVDTPTDIVECHVGLKVDEKRQLVAALSRLQDEGKITDFTVDKHQPEYRTIGFDDTLDMVMSDLRLNEENADA